MSKKTMLKLSDDLDGLLIDWTSSHNISKSEFITQVLAEKLEELYESKRQT